MTMKVKFCGCVLAIGCLVHAGACVTNECGASRIVRAICYPANVVDFGPESTTALGARIGTSNLSWVIVTQRMDEELSSGTYDWGYDAGPAARADAFAKYFAEHGSFVAEKDVRVVSLERRGTAACGRIEFSTDYGLRGVVDFEVECNGDGVEVKSLSVPRRGAAAEGEGLDVLSSRHRGQPLRMDFTGGN